MVKKFNVKDRMPAYRHNEQESSKQFAAADLPFVNIKKLISDLELKLDHCYVPRIIPFLSMEFHLTDFSDENAKEE